MNPDAVYNQLALELKSIEDQIRELKQRQYNGTDTVQTYVNKNEAWDIDWTPVFGFASASKNIVVQFFSDNQDAATNALRYEILIDNSVWFTTATFNDHPQDLAILGNVRDIFGAYSQEQPSSKRSDWYFNITAYRSGMNVKVRFIVDSTDTGRISLKEI